MVLILHPACIYTLYCVIFAVPTIKVEYISLPFDLSLTLCLALPDVILGGVRWQKIFKNFCVIGLTFLCL